jgi:hypothetical protein
VIKHYWKMKQRQRYRLSSIGRKCDTCGGVKTSDGGEATLGGEREETTPIGLTRILLG